MPSPGGTGGVPGFGGHGSGTCSPTKPILQFTIPATDLVFVVGRNYSMSSKFGDSTRMTAVQMDLHSIVSGNQTPIEFGYESYPSFTGCSGGGTCCPSSEQTVRAMPFVNNIDDALYAPCDPNGSGMGMGCVAPTDSRAISQAMSWNVIGDLFGPSPDSASQRYAVLIADGPPGCPTEEAGKACGAAQSAVSSLFKNGGIKTFVIGVGEDANNDGCLAQLATMGGTVTPFDVADSTSLMKALTQIVSMAAVTPCTINLNAPLDDPYLLSIYVQNEEVPLDTAGGNGWNYAPNSWTRIQLHGTACQYLQSFHFQPQIHLWYGCPPCTAANPTPGCL